jgi:hypothetical protein
MTKFSTKKYTRPFIISNIKNLPTSAFVDTDTLARALSPRAGRRSAQFAALKKFVNLNKVFDSGSAKTVKQNLLRALR